MTPLYGVGGELTVIASVIIGGASILGGRGRVFGSCLGALLVVLIDKVLREGWPITRTMVIDGQEIAVRAKYTLPAGAVSVFLGLLLVIAVLVEPWLIRRQVAARFWAWLRGRPPPLAYETGGVAIEGVQTKGAMVTDMALSATGVGKFLARRDALAIMLAVLLWLTGVALRPDYWWNLSNSFAILLNYTELALITIGLTYVIAAGDIDLSVGAVLALAGSTAAYFLKVLGADPDDRRGDGPAGRDVRRPRQRHRHRRLQAAGLHRHPRHVLHRPRPRRLVRRRPAAHRLAGGLQPARPQGERHPAALRHRACRPASCARSPRS